MEQHEPSTPLEPPEPLVVGITLFNAGHYWEAHEAWEALWLRAQGNDRLLYQGLILLAAALHKRWVHGSLTSNNYAKACAKLDLLPPEYAARYGLNISQVCQDVAVALRSEGLRPQIVLYQQV